MQERRWTATPTASNKGFKKKDILQYFKEHREANTANRTKTDVREPAAEIEAEPAPSTVDLAIRVLPSDEDSRECDRDLIKDEQGTTGRFESKRTEVSPALDLPTQPPHRHAPRHSSLLRFAKAASSDSAYADETELTHVYQGLPARIYRPRTETYSYSQSELSETDLNNGIRNLHIDSTDEDIVLRVRQRSPSPMRPEAQIFVLESQDPGMTMARIQFSDQPHPPNPDRGSSPSVTTHVPQPVVATRRSSIGATAIQREHHHTNTRHILFPSSPPTSKSQEQQDSSLNLPSLPATPIRPRLSTRNVHTEPRIHGPQDLDGSFAVYNDALPSSAQPQTPADIVRHQVITEHEAAYTVPVGVLHTPMRSHRTNAVGDTGEQSPIVRAIGMRERRARELMRSVRAEGVHLGRMRQQDREWLARGTDRNEEHRNGASEREGLGPTVLEQWRDDLEVDRVGDENWEGELEAGGRTERVEIEIGLRVASGNAHAGRGWWEERDGV